MNLTTEQLQEVAAYLATEEVQAVLSQLLIDLDYAPEKGNPLVFALGTLAAKYGDYKTMMSNSEKIRQAQEIINEQQAIIDGIENGE